MDEKDLGDVSGRILLDNNSNIQFYFKKTIVVAFIYHYIFLFMTDLRFYEYSSGNPVGARLTKKVTFKLCNR